MAKVGQPLCEIEVEAESAEDNQPGESTSESVESQSQLVQDPATSTQSSEFGGVDMEGFTSTSTPGTSSGSAAAKDILATPAVRRVSREHNVNLADVVGTGKDGRITKEDVLKFIQGGPSQSSTTQSSDRQPTQATQSPAGETQVIDLDPVRRAMFRAMTSTLHTPHFAYSDEIDVTALEKIRALLSANVPSKYRRSLAAHEEQGLDRVEEESRFDKLTMLPLLVKAMSMALHEHPLFRSTLSLPPSSPEVDGNVQKISSQAKLHRRSSHDISIALSSPAGLLTPCLTRVETKSIFDLSSNIVRLQSRASSPKGLGPSDLKATGTITLSNIGAVGGGTYTHPLIPPTGQLAIGALGRTRPLPRFASEVPGAGKKATIEDPDRVVRRLIMPVSFTGDHRVVEGAELAKLVNRWKALVESPELWLGLLH